MNYAVLPNETLQKMIHKNLSELGGISYNEEEVKFAEEIYQTLVSPSLQLGSQNMIKNMQLLIPTDQLMLVI